MLPPCFGITDELLDTFGDETENLSGIISLLPTLYAVKTAVKAFSTHFGKLLDALHFFGT